MMQFQLVHLTLYLRLHTSQGMDRRNKGHCSVVEQPRGDSRSLDEPELRKRASQPCHLRRHTPYGMHGRRNALMPAITKLPQAQPLLMALMQAHLLSMHTVVGVSSQ